MAPADWRPLPNPNCHQGYSIYPVARRCQPSGGQHFGTRTHVYGFAAKRPTQKNTFCQLFKSEPAANWQDGEAITRTHPTVQQDGEAIPTVRQNGEAITPTHPAVQVVPNVKRRFRITEKADNGFLELRSGPGVTFNMIAQSLSVRRAWWEIASLSPAATCRSARWNGMGNTDGPRHAALPTLK
jgi:hypothetical protein